MFRHLFDFRRQRTTVEALGFYLFHLVVGAILVLATAALAGTVTDGPSPAPLAVTRPTEGATTVSDGRTTIVASADGTTTVTVGDGARSDAEVVIAADGSASVKSRSGSPIVSNSGDSTSVTVDGVRIVVSADGSTSVHSPSVGPNSVRDLVGVAVAVLFAATVSLLVLRGKGHLGDVGYLLVVAASLVAAAIGGLALGLPFAAFLSTRPAAPTRTGALTTA